MKMKMKSVLNMEQIHHPYFLLVIMSSIPSRPLQLKISSLQGRNPLLLSNSLTKESIRKVYVYDFFYINLTSSNILTFLPITPFLSTFPLSLWVKEWWCHRYHASMVENRYQTILPTPCSIVVIII